MAKEVTKAQVEAAEYMTKLPKHTVNPKNARKGIGMFTPATAGPPKQPQIYTNALYKLTATHERLLALKMEDTAAVLFNEIVSVTRLLESSTAYWQKDREDADEFVKELDVARIGQLGIKPEAMREFLDGQK